jgi:uncharacterized protein YuzE
MKIQYFEGSDTLHIVFHSTAAVETRDLDDDSFYDVDERGQLVSITIERAKERHGDPSASYEKIPARMPGA